MKFIIDSGLKQRNNWDKKYILDQIKQMWDVIPVVAITIDGQYYYQTVYKMAPSDLSVGRPRMKDG